MGKFVILMSRKDKKPGRTAAKIKARSLSVLARSANIFSRHDVYGFNWISMHDFSMNDTAIEALMAEEDEIEQASRSMKAIAHPLRLRILCTLGAQEISVHDIVDRVGTSQSNISQHLAILRDKGILAARKDANRVYYRVGDSRTLRLIGMMREIFCET
uniref:DNA-binding transcriptional regulator, ArsR family n=1 Tax=Candidatus Kentrum sp. SD TaxID=2126332 RepID=A0A450Z2N4_9GAMM|nr:MAG: DNA-binding transcriptional regulator, ArsR family [Candidatus Kentron sp. SD]VFK48009.1 MAG: DNA-binding transcriptional regulator, ArsR family [Candidatus Kentron sp. SD]VFK79133.1 MAG: DNA-binding transcriptional regulator, ArsR family [Candidatus Kentron sp. SD]